MSVSVLAVVSPLPQFRTQVIGVLKSIAVSAHTKSGVQKFVLLDSGDDIFIYERWNDRAAWDAHANEPLPDELRSRLEKWLLREPVHHYLDPISVGLEEFGSM